MTLPLFFVPGLPGPGSPVTLDEASSRHCVQVLRRRAGDEVLLTDGQGTSCVSVIQKADKRHCLVLPGARQQTPPPSPRLAVAVAFTKNLSRIEWFIEKATEIGITEIIPVLAERSERVHYPPQRLHHLMVSAMLQSRQVYLPQLGEPATLEAILRIRGSYPGKYIAHCGEGEKPFLGRITRPGEDSLVLIGPEGDFSASEIATAEAMACQGVSLGPTRLRTETAALVASTLLRAANA